MKKTSNLKIIIIGGLLLALLYISCSGDESAAPVVDDSQTQTQAPTITVDPKLYGTIDQLRNTTLTNAGVIIENGTLENKVYVEQTNGNLLQVGNLQKDSNGKYLLDSTAINTNTIQTIFDQELGTVVQRSLGTNLPNRREFDLITRIKGEDGKIYNVNFGEATACKNGTIYNSNFGGSCETP